MRAPWRNDFLVDDWLVTPSQGLLTRGEEIARPEPKAMDVLVHMASRPNEVITRDVDSGQVLTGNLCPRS